MESKQNWRLRYWIIGGYAVPVVALIMSAIITVFNTNIVSHRSDDLVSSYDIKSLIDDLDSNVQSNSKSLRGYLLDKNQTSLRNYQKSQSNLKELLSKLSAIPELFQERQSLIRLEELLNQLNEINSNLIAKVDQGKAREATEIWIKNDTRDLVEAIAGKIDELQSRETVKVATAAKQQQEALSTLRLVILLASVLSLLLSVLIGFWVIRRTTQQMNSSASAIATSTTEIATTIAQQERAAIQQATSVNQTTTTMDELGASSRQSAEQAKASADNAQQVLMLIDGRVQETQQGQSNQSSLRGKVGDIAAQILHLSEQANQIGMISTLVSDLASQTNMLALNAAVEAVRAGEHGKGFAVVAAEIRKLADQSKASAEKINGLVGEIQKSTNSTVTVTNEGTRTVEEIVDAMKTIALNGQQIALTSNQQAIAVQQVVEAMNSLNITARETASGIGQIKAGTQQLNEAAQNLKAVV